MTAPSFDVRSAASAAVAELVAQLRAEAGELPDAWKRKARDLADAAATLATDYALGKIDADQFARGRDDLVLVARSMAAEVGLDMLGKRRALVSGAVPIIVRMLVSLASGGTIV